MDEKELAVCVGLHSGDRRSSRSVALRTQFQLSEVETHRKAERLIESCEGCNPAGAEIPVDNILDRITGSDPSVTDYILELLAKCPNYRREILEKTLVEPT